MTQQQRQTKSTDNSEPSVPHKHTCKFSRHYPGVTFRASGGSVLTLCRGALCAGCAVSLGSFKAPVFQEFRILVLGVDFFTSVLKFSWLLWVLIHAFCQICGILARLLHMLTLFVPRCTRRSWEPKVSLRLCLLYPSVFFLFLQLFPLSCVSSLLFFCLPDLLSTCISPIVFQWFGVPFVFRFPDSLFLFCLHIVFLIGHT